MESFATTKLSSPNKEQQGDSALETKYSTRKEKDLKENLHSPKDMNDLKVESESPKFKKDVKEEILVK